MDDSKFSEIGSGSFLVLYDFGANHRQDQGESV